jgi:hypothetical protein
MHIQTLVAMADWAEITTELVAALAALAVVVVMVFGTAHRAAGRHCLLVRMVVLPVLLETLVAVAVQVEPHQVLLVALGCNLLLLALQPIIPTVVAAQVALLVLAVLLLVVEVSLVRSVLMLASWL